MTNSGVNGGNSVVSVGSGNAGPTYLQAKIQIGSIKGPITYKREQQVFHHDDIPESRRNRKEEVKKWLKSNILSVDRRNWQKSSALKKEEGYGYAICERRQAENIVKDRSMPYNYNYRAETLKYAYVSAPVDQPGKFHISRTTMQDLAQLDSVRLQDRVQRGFFKRTEEMPTHLDVVGKTSWNNSTQMTAKEKLRGLNKLTQRARVSTARINRAISTSEDYLGPMSQQHDISRTVRSQKSTGSFVGGPNGTFNGHHVLAPTVLLPRANSPSTGNDNVPVSAPGSPSVSSPRGGRGDTAAGKTRSKQPSRAATADPSETKNRYAIEPSRKHTTTKHSGVWELSKADGRMMWSDTGSFIYESRGDVLQTTNPDALNLEGPTLSKPSKAASLKPRDHVDHR
jgi:hypothetical protein